MITAIREVRRAKRLTLADVAARCDPPTTAQTIGRLETGTRTVSVAWLNRIATALGVTASDLVRTSERADLRLVAVLAADGVRAPPHEASIAPPAVSPDHVAMHVETGIGDYRAGDDIWCVRLAPEAFGLALNRDVLAPRPAGRFLFGRLIGRDDGRLHILPPGAGARQQVIADPGWIAVATRLVRRL
ncbi:helix-turn-helix domain-containing protein [Sphingomonas colocasiae]|uniref:Helix-turn-helix domain-containing protein n=1 Tax=Sphingomonas colocasiae TaxID=1848973 RepID=A0ABS7PHZ2_9SPHN|nr:helix-turn-helix transcriptional regulator [Sphingomonas colocasiae]MBY8820863.1 helix-turn-helix domain-containing protein [Sphingomonas colocasiae]